MNPPRLCCLVAALLFLALTFTVPQVAAMEKVVQFQIAGCNT